MQKKTSMESDQVLHSWSVPSQWNSVDIVSGQGSFFTDANGSSYLDLSSQAECNNLGHQHPEVIKAIEQQLHQLCYIQNSWGSEPRRLLAEQLLELSGFEGGRVFFTLGGADANEHAVKFARLASGNPKGLVISRDRSYHGASYAAAALSGDVRTSYMANEQAMGVVKVPPPYYYRCPFGSPNQQACGTAAVSAVGAVIEQHQPDGVCAVLMEANAGTNGIVAPDNYWPELRQLTKDKGVLLIADEVMSGFGRCGQWFAWQQHGEAGRPDLMTIAKGLTGAHLPLGAVIMSAEVYEKIQHQMIATGLTYCGHPLSCAAGLGAIRAYQQEQLIEKSRRLGKPLLERLKLWQSRQPLIGDVRGGHGLFAVVELVADRESKAMHKNWPATPAPLAALSATALAQGLSVATRGNLLIIAPPLVIDEQLLWNAIDQLESILANLTLN